MEGEEPAQKLRHSVEIGGPLVVMKAPRPTGTSDAFWKLRTAGKYAEALALVRERCAGGDDGEAEAEMYDLYRYGHLGVQEDLEAGNVHGFNAKRLGCDVRDSEVYLSSGKDIEYWARRGHPVACRKHAVMLMGFSFSWGGGGGLVLMFYHKTPWGCSPIPVLDHRVPLPTLPWDEILRYLRTGAMQGDLLCRGELIRVFLCVEHLVDWRRAALMIIDPEVQSDDMRLAWLGQCLTSHDVQIRCREWDRCDETRIDLERRREAYVYGKYFAGNAPKDPKFIGPAESMIKMYHDVRDKARAAAVALWAVLRRRALRWPRDIAVLMCKTVWASRELRTELWK